MVDTVDSNIQGTTPTGDESPATPAQPLPYERVGGSEGLARIVDRFYEIMDQDPAAAAIRAMHGDDLGPIREKLFDFLSGWLGGPPLYFQRPDSKCLHSAHQPYAIGTDERDQWLACMHRALMDTGVDAETRKLLEKPLFMVADSVRNR
ncbi:MAG: hemoglobin [Alphaproteobacteria bacterium]|jgi:hemoglobin